MSIESQMDAAYKKKVLGMLDKATRKLAIDIQNDVESQTPVDTGRARSNWLPSIGTARKDTTESTGGSPVINFTSYQLGDKIYITNNLPYIARLNDGYSKQAPAAYVDMAIQRQVNQLRAALRLIK